MSGGMVVGMVASTPDARKGTLTQLNVPLRFVTSIVAAPYTVSVESDCNTIFNCPPERSAPSADARQIKVYC